MVVLAQRSHCEFGLKVKKSEQTKRVEENAAQVGRSRFPGALAVPSTSHKAGQGCARLKSNRTGPYRAHPAMFAFTPVSRGSWTQVAYITRRILSPPCCILPRLISAF